MVKKIKIIATIILGLIILASITFYFHGQYKESQALAEYQKTIEEISTSNIVRTDLSPERIEKIKEAIEPKITIFLNNPEDVSSYIATLSIGAFKQDVGDYQGAEQAWLWASKIQPKAYPPYSNLGYLYFRHFQDFAKAEEAYLKVVELAPYTDIGYLELHQIYRYFYKQDSGLAEAILMQGIKANPQNNGLMAELGDYYKDTDQRDKAIEWYQKALEIEPNDQYTNQQLADI